VGGWLLLMHNFVLILIRPFFQWNDDFSCFDCHVQKNGIWVQLFDSIIMMSSFLYVLNSHHHYHQPLKFLNFHSMREGSQPLNESPFLERIVLIYRVGWMSIHTIVVGSLSLSLNPLSHS
jgi:hypothetical protein